MRILSLTTEELPAWVTVYRMQTQPRNAFALKAIQDQGALPVFLIRHGQTSWNKERRFLGRSDIPLDATGLEQARKLAHALASTPIHRLYSSPLSRAMQTADAIASALHLAPETVNGLTELNQGELEGMEGRLLAERYPDFYRDWVHDPTHVRIPGGETLAECQARAVESIHRVLGELDSTAPVALVSHKVAISGIICDCLGLPPRFNMMVGQANTAINVLAFKDGRLSLVRLNDAAHLVG